MDIKLLTVGKTDVKWVKEGLDLYVSRLAHYVPFSLIEIPQLKNVSSFSKDQIKEKEGELILKQLKNSDLVWLLDERARSCVCYRGSLRVLERCVFQSRRACLAI